MKTITTLITIAMLTADLSATSFAPRESHNVSSTNGKFKLHVNVENNTHRITGDFGEGADGWQFQHNAGFHSFFVSDDGQAAAVVNWVWCGGFGLELNKPAVSIYGRAGLKRTYTYNQLSKPRERKPDEVGPIGDFWRVWREKATLKGNVLTIDVEGSNPRVIDVTNPQDLPPLEAAATSPKSILKENGEPDVEMLRDIIVDQKQRQIPETWKPYGSPQFELKEGLRMYHTQGSIIVDHDEGATIDRKPVEELLYIKLERADNVPKVFAGIRNETQARELCELLINGAMVKDAKTYQELLKVHRAEGLEPLVKDEELNFEKVTKTVEGGFLVEFTALHLPQVMGGQSIVARYKFIVGKDAGIKIETTPYIKGLYLNWQTAMLDTKEKMENEGRKQSRVAKFIHDCLTVCPHSLPIPPDGRE